MGTNIAIIVIALIFSAFFSGMEIAFVASNKLRIELDKNKGRFPSEIISIFTKRSGQYIATMLVGNNIAIVIYGIIIARLLDPVIGMYITSSEIWILVLQTIISTLIILFVAEFLPKTLFRINPNIALNVFSIPVLFFFIIFYPITKFSMWISNGLFKRILKVDVKQENKEVFGRIDLNHLVSESNKSISNTDINHEIKIFRNALDFANIKVRECMVPRPEIVAVEADNELEQLRDKFVETGFSKILVYDNSIDNTIGYFHSSELFRNPQDIRTNLIEPFIVPESMSAKKLLRKFIQERKSLAVVVDEFGGTSGIVTIEDIMEEIFGEIEDEHDTTELIEKQVSESEFEFSGRFEIDYINEKYNLDIPVSEEYETIAGFILFHHKNIPNQSDSIKISPFTFKIKEVSETRIELVELETDIIA